jgi:hypothetical protein
VANDDEECSAPVELAQIQDPVLAAQAPAVAPRDSMN